MIQEYTPSALVEAAHEANRVSEAAIEATCRAEALKDGAKDLLSRLMNSIDADHDEKLSESKLERLARGTPEWTTYRAGQFAAAFEAEKLSVASYGARRIFDALTSALSYKKEEMKHGV